MYLFNFLQRQKELYNHFRIGRQVELTDSHLQIRSYEFKSVVLPPVYQQVTSEFAPDISIAENNYFNYQVFTPIGMTRTDSFILLLHGLNERSWDKYLIWAEYLALHTRKPVVLFPIAFHINRAPAHWGDPRSMMVVMEKRKQEGGDHRSLSFVNAALSVRLSQEPLRFFCSGRQTLHDLIALMWQIRSGTHPLFTPDATADIFSYSIGSFLAEILLMSNPYHLFDQSRLFIFCGGSIFSHMYGESRCIMDKRAYEKLYHFYCHEWRECLGQLVDSGQVMIDGAVRAFNAMINPDEECELREQFFSSGSSRIAGISLGQDRVMPFAGVEACMGSRLAGKCFEQIDFPYAYTHEFPFPTHGRVEEKALNDSFTRVFHKAALFLA